MSEQNEVRIRSVICSNGDIYRTAISDAEWLEDQARIRDHKYFSLMPELYVMPITGEPRPYIHFTWWKLKITWEPWRETRSLCVMWADKTKPPIYHTLISFKQSASHEPFIIGN